MNIIDYVINKGGLSFTDAPFNEIDSLILCQLAYLNYGPFVGNILERRKDVKLKDIYESEHYEELFKNYWYEEDNHKLIDAMVHSLRFGELRLNYFESVYNENLDTQFSALTYILEGGQVYLAYRGTDATMLGWKEDLKLAYSKPVEAQKLSVRYMTMVSELFEGEFRVGGHSKGGNLAVYASMMCDKEIRDRILQIYSNDGPGFRPEILAGSHIDEIKDRMYKFIPKESIVGIIMNEDEDSVVIESTGIGTFQHNTYTWKCGDSSLLRAEGMTSFKQISDAALNKWIYSLSTEEIDRFIEAMFEIMSSDDNKTLFDIKEDPIKALQAMVATYRDLDEKAKVNLSTLMDRLRLYFKELAVSEFKERFDIDDKISELSSKVEKFLDNKDGI